MSWKQWSADEVSNQLESKGFAAAGPLFIRHEITGDLLPYITEEHLVEMGIHSIGQRLLIIKCISDWVGKQSQQRLLTPQVTDREQDNYGSAPKRVPTTTSQQRPTGTPKRVQTSSSNSTVDSAEKPKYVRDHEKMVESIRAARRYDKYQKDLQEGKAVGPPPDLPPIEEPEGLVECPICHRKFGEEGAKHHIPVCQRMNEKKFRAGKY